MIELTPQCDLRLKYQPNTHLARTGVRCERETVNSYAGSYKFMMYTINTNVISGDTEKIRKRWLSTNQVHTTFYDFVFIFNIICHDILL